MSKSVTFWIPQLLHSSRLEQASEQLKSIKLPWLSGLLSKADVLAKKPRQDFYQTASYLFHQPVTLPIAPLLASIELAKADLSKFWIKLDPVQLIADRDSLILIPAKDLNISEQESRDLLDAFNQHFAVENVQLEYASKDSWFLNIAQEVDVQTTSIEDLAYKPLDDAYPKGNAATYWKKLLNETQMLFYTHPVNEARREQNLPEINSVWAWAEGKLDSANIKLRENCTIHSNNIYLQGLAKQTKSKLFEESKSYEIYNLYQQGGGGEHDLICLDSVSQNLENLNEQEWIESLVKLDKLWFEPLYQQLKTGKIDSLLIDLGMEKRYHLTPKLLKRFWRFNKPIQKFN